MERTFSKPPAARQVEARARARQYGVKVAVVSEARRYVAASQQQPGVVYAIERCAGYLARPSIIPRSFSPQVLHSLNGRAR